MHPAIIVLIIAAVIGLAILGHLRAKKRREALAALAASLGWSFVPGYDYDHDEEYAQFEIFRRGRSRAAFNTLYGELDIAGVRASAKAGDFRYKVDSGSGKNRSTSTYTFSYLICDVPWRDAPALLIRPEGMFDKLASVVGFDDIDFESAEFSRKFYVKSQDKKFAYDVVHPRMMEFLMARRPPMIDLEHGRVCLSAGSGRWSPEEYQAMILMLDEFLELWPEHVTHQLEARS